MGWQIVTLEGGRLLSIVSQNPFAQAGDGCTMEERLPSGAGHGTEGMIEAPATGPTQARATDAAGARSCADA